jgi:hypothetical protein
MSNRSSYGAAVCVAIVVVVAVSACVKPPFARLESAVVGDQSTGSPARANVRVIRGDSVVDPSISMRILKGDSIITSSSTRVVVTFAAGYEVTLDTSTAIYIENPSIFLRIGQAFIRRLRGTPDTLTTHTPQAVLHDAGTAYLVTVTPRATSVRVEEGAVDAGARDGGYPIVRYSRLDQGEITLGAGPQRMAKLQPAELETHLTWVRQVARISKVPSGKTLLQPRALCTVPLIVGKTEAEAKRLLKAAGLQGESTQRIGRTDVVATQAEKETSKLACGSTVHYTWGRR